MSQNRGIRQRTADLALDAFEHLMAMLHGPVAGNQDMHGHKPQSAGLASSKGVILQPLLMILGQQRLDLMRFLSGRALSIKPSMERRISVRQPK